MIEVLRKGYNYLASPYSSPAPAVRHLRYTQAVRAAAGIKFDADNYELELDGEVMEL